MFDEIINIFDLDDPSSTSIEFIIFRERQMTVQSHKHLYEVVLTEAYKEIPELILTPEAKEKIKVNENQTNLRSPIHIGNKYYAEGHLNAKTIHKLIRFLLRVYGWEEELSLKISPNL